MNKWMKKADSGALRRCFDVRHGGHGLRWGR